MSGESERPSWGFLALMGLIGGGPTFVGTVIGQAWVSEALGVVFFALAAGSILYVVIQLLEVCRRHAMPSSSPGGSSPGSFSVSQQISSWSPPEPDLP